MSRKPLLLVIALGWTWTATSHAELPAKGTYAFSHGDFEAKLVLRKAGPGRVAGKLVTDRGGMLGHIRATKTFDLRRGEDGRVSGHMIHESHREKIRVSEQPLPDGASLRTIQITVADAGQIDRRANGEMYGISRRLSRSGFPADRVVVTRTYRVGPEGANLLKEKIHRVNGPGKEEPAGRIEKQIYSLSSFTKRNIEATFASHAEGPLFAGLTAHSGLGAAMTRLENSKPTVVTAPASAAPPSPTSVEGKPGLGAWLRQVIKW